MAKQRLSVVYNGPEDRPYIDAELDAALEKLLAEFGYECWASGCDLVPPFERDLAFQRESNEDVGGQDA